MTTDHAFDSVPFSYFKQKVQAQFNKMSKAGQLFVVGVEKDKIYNLYLDSFPAGTNNIYKERREYDCNCCKQFIRDIGSVVCFIDGKLTSIWDIEVGGYYQVVVEALAAELRNTPISNVFTHHSKTAGTDRNHQLSGDGTVKEWEHFFTKVPNEYVKAEPGSYLSETRSNKEVLFRSLHEISLDSAETVLELIDQNSLYRGEEHKATVKLFIKHKKEFMKLGAAGDYCWQVSVELGGASKIRNTVIGTLMSDISEGKELDKAVASFEAKVAPQNYKRTSAVLTKGMIKKLQATVEAQGLGESLYRRYAVPSDLTINNVIFADRTAKQNLNSLDVFGEMLEEASSEVCMKSLEKVEEVGIEKFISDILPKASSVDMLVENKHVSNLMSLVAPKFADSPNIMKWDNNFTWTYNGEVADSIEEKVKAAGGRTDGVLRLSHTWNADGQNQSLMDLHVFLPGSGSHQTEGKEVHDKYPNGNRVGWNMRKDTKTRGIQDVDFTDPPLSVVPVENITFPDERLLPNGKYVFKIHNWQARSPNMSGFSAEVAINGEVYEYYHPKPLSDKQWITLAVATKSSKGWSIEHKLAPSSASKEVWNITTHKWTKVDMAMLSPNHWDDNETGNKHWFFMLNQCKQPGQARGFYNEYLKNEYSPLRKAFEGLSSKLKTEESDQQLSGVGFSSTQRNHAFFKVTGKFTRTIKVVF